MISCSSLEECCVWGASASDTVELSIERASWGCRLRRNHGFLTLEPLSGSSSLPMVVACSQGAR